MLLPAGSALSNPGYTFTGWNTAADGSGSSYAAGASFMLNADVTLYAQWTLETFIVSFDPEGGTVSPASVTFTPGSPDLILPTPVDAGFTFSGWYSAASGGTLEGRAGGSFAPTSSVVLYAQWAASAPIVVNFSANGGSGSPVTIDETPGGTITLPSASNFVRSGYALSSWNSQANGAGTSYELGANVSLAASTTLYAQWTKHRVYSLFGAVGNFKSVSVTLTPALRAQVIRLAKAIKARHYTSVTLYGYTAATGLASLNRSVSEHRALNVERFLRATLVKMKVKGVTLRATGEGAVGGGRAPGYSRVEVFVQ